MRVVGWLLLGVMGFSQCGCLDTLVRLLYEPESVALDTAGSAVASQGTGQAVDDIDRILAENPDVANREQLLAMRAQLAGQSQTGAVQAVPDMFDSPVRRISLIDRGLPKRKRDYLRLRERFSFDRTATAMPECPVVPPNGRLFAEESSIHAVDLAPVRTR